MLSVYQIQRYFHARHFDPLLRGVVPIGLELPLPLQIRLSGQPGAVLALSLRRVLELTYGPTALSRELTAALLNLQNADGSFGDADGRDQPAGDPLATAAAVAALTALGREHASTPNPEAAVARERAIVALAHHQADEGLFHCPADRTDEDRALTSAFILTLLGGDDDFRHAVRYADLLNWFDDHAQHLDGSACLLWRLAQVDAAPVPSHELAAIAA
jgi:hypothetical protein